jgi:predicted flap endonuclease-1-like 5' DNA nuclease
MKAFKVFVFGLLYGWFLKFAMDKIYGKNTIQMLSEENTSLQDYIRSLETQLHSKTPESQSAARPVARPATPPLQQSRPNKTNTRKDDLKLINGIGPALEKRLNDTGIYTFADLVQLTPEELEARLGNPKRVATADLIEQAKGLQNNNEAGTGAP